MLPAPKHAIADRDYETAHGRASLVVEAGRLAHPDQPKRWIRCGVPAGSKPRLILPYIIGQAVRGGRPEVDLGTSLREFMARLRMPVTGHNGKALTEQIQNLAAANITIGEWSEDVVHTHTARIAKRVSFWIEKDPNQLTFWTPTMTLSEDFFRAVGRPRNAGEPDPTPFERPDDVVALERQMGLNDT